VTEAKENVFESIGGRTCPLKQYIDCMYILLT